MAAVPRLRPAVLQRTVSFAALGDVAQDRRDAAGFAGGIAEQDDGELQ